MTFRWVLALALALAPAVGCRNTDPLPPPSDPEGKDLVKGAIVAAVEKDGTYRLNKIIHVDDYPPPIGYEYHLIAYDPVVPNYEEAVKLQKRGKKTVALSHILVRHMHFIKREHRVIAHEPVSDEEFAIYQRSRR